MRNVEAELSPKTRKVRKWGAVFALALSAAGCTASPTDQTAPAHTKFEPVDCTHPVVNTIYGDYDSQATYDKAKDIVKQTQEEICTAANLIGKKTLQLFKHHPKSITFRSDSSGGEYTIDMTDHRNGNYSEVTYYTNRFGSPGKLEEASVGTNRVVDGKLKNDSVGFYIYPKSGWTLDDTQTMSIGDLPAINTSEVLKSPSPDELNNRALIVTATIFMVAKHIK